MLFRVLRENVHPEAMDSLRFLPFRAERDTTARATRADCHSPVAHSGYPGQDSETRPGNGQRPWRFCRGQLTLAFFAWGPSSSTQCSLVPEPIRLASETCTERFLEGQGYEGDRQEHQPTPRFPALSPPCHIPPLDVRGPERKAGVSDPSDIPSFPPDPELTAKGPGHRR